MRVRIRVTGGSAPPEVRLHSLREWLGGDVAWTVTPGSYADELTTDVADAQALARLAAAVGRWRAAQRDAGRVEILSEDGTVEIHDSEDGTVEIHGGTHNTGVVTADHDAPTPDLAPGRATPPGPVLDPGDDWPEG